MVYTPTSNPVVAYVQPKASGHIKQWIYFATDPAATVATDGYFSDGYDRGVRKGDLIWSFDSGANEMGLRRVVTSTATGGVSTDLLVDPNAGVARSHRKFDAAGTCTVNANTDDIVEISKDTTGGSATPVQLPLVSARTSGRSITVVDGLGDASTNNITVSPAGADTIVGLSSWVINFDGGAVSITPNFDEDKWLVI